MSGEGSFTRLMQDRARGRSRRGEGVRLKAREAEISVRSTGHGERTEGRAVAGYCPAVSDPAPAGPRTGDALDGGGDRLAGGLQKRGVPVGHGGIDRALSGSGRGEKRLCRRCEESSDERAGTRGEREARRG